MTSSSTTARGCTTKWSKVRSKQYRIVRIPFEKQWKTLSLTSDLLIIWQRTSRGNSFWTTQELPETKAAIWARKRIGSCKTVWRSNQVQSTPKPNSKSSTNKCTAGPCRTPTTSISKSWPPATCITGWRIRTKVRIRFMMGSGLRNHFRNRSMISRPPSQ